MNPNKKSQMIFSLNDHMYEMPHNITPYKCERTELKIESDLKTHFKDDDLENYGENSFQQGEDHVPMEGHINDHANKLPKSRDVQEMLQTMRDHQEGQGLLLPGPFSRISNFLTLVA